MITMNEVSNFLFTAGVLLGVFDGHGGGACAQVVSKRLFHYISACLLPPKLLQQYLNSISSEKKLELLQTFNDKVEFITEIRDLYQASFLNFIKDLMRSNDRKEFQMEKALENAFLRLDNDLSDEALLQLNKKDAARTLAVAMSGAVAAVAHIDGPHLHVAGVGDCQAILGVLSGNFLIYFIWIEKGGVSIRPFFRPRQNYFKLCYIISLNETQPTRTICCPSN